MGNVLSLWCENSISLLPVIHHESQRFIHPSVPEIECFARTWTPHFSKQLFSASSQQLNHASSVGQLSCTQRPLYFFSLAEVVF